MTQQMAGQQAGNILEQVIDNGMARVIVTYEGRSGDLADPVSRDATHDDVRRMVQEALRTGGVAGIPPIPRADLSGFVVELLAPNEAQPTHRLMVRPKTAFGHAGSGDDGIRVRPLGDRVLVERIKPEEKSPGGIFIPDSAQAKSTEGRVVAVGRGRVHEQTGKIIPLEVKVGDKVIFGKYGGNETTAGGHERIVLREDDILAVVEE